MSDFAINLPLTTFIPLHFSMLIERSIDLGILSTVFAKMDVDSSLFAMIKTLSAKFI